MARVVVLTDSGEEVGEIEVFPLGKPSAKSKLGFDGTALTAHWLEALRLDEVEAQKAEYEAQTL